jgi:nicotinate-nucleotide pyrophosphorylase (carboxylating)
VILRGLNEDLGTAGDLTSAATVPEDTTLTAHYVARQPGTAAGLPVLSAVTDVFTDASVHVDPRCEDGDRLAPGDRLADITGNARSILAIERLSLNLLGHLCGIATVTTSWLDAVAGSAATIRDTRKTTPGLRDLEKYAVRCGGGVNHRRGLDDAVLIKDNHVAAAGGVGSALDAVYAAYPSRDLVIQVEVDDLDQLTEALAHGATQVLLDNFSLDDLRSAVEVVRAGSRPVQLEASGGLRLDSAAAVAATGVDFLAVGALTHSAPYLDIGLDAD